MPIAERLLFIYGTLLDAELFEAVTGLTHAAANACPACLEGFRRVNMRGQAYPTLVCASASRTQGLLVGPLAEAVWDRLRIYEGEAYELRPVAVETGAGPVEAVVFLADAAHASAQPWRLEAWQRRAKAAALAGLGAPRRRPRPHGGAGADRADEPA